MNPAICRRLLPYLRALSLLLATATGLAAAQPLAAPAPAPLPPAVEAALARARLPRDALSVLVVDARTAGRLRV